MSAPRFVVLKSRTDLELVAATWPFGSIERTALAVYDQAGTSETAAKMAAEQFRDQTLVVLELADAEAEVRAHLNKRNQKQRSDEFLAGRHVTARRASPSKVPNERSS